MRDALIELIDESIRMELNVAELYLFFQSAFPEDVEFWWQLALEEKNHAALIRSLKEHFLPLGKFPRDLLSSSLEDILESNAYIDRLLSRYRQQPPGREEAFRTACLLEDSAAEIHFQKFMSRKGSSKLDEIFRRLNADDRDHGERIRSYMAARGISPA